MDQHFAIWTAALVGLVLFFVWRSTTSRNGSNASLKAALKIEEKSSNPYEDIRPLPNFDVSTTPPIKVRPFDPKYHLTMKIEKCPMEELFEFDKTYLNRMALRQKIMDENMDETIQCNPVAEAAVFELHDWLFRTFLPRRFPTIFQLRSIASSSSSSSTDEPQTQSHPTHLYNLATRTSLPLSPTSTTQALYALSSTIDSEFLLLLPSSQNPETNSPIYHLEAFAVCFPSGFRTKDKLSLPLAAIHAPVPRYGAKLEKSMDRFFARLECGRAVKRANWTVTTDDRLFTLSGPHAKVETVGEGVDATSPEEAARIEKEAQQVVVEDCRLRCERQTLHRLARSGAILFAFKTYLYTLDEVKAEGSGPELADAIDGLGTGTVPELEIYKRSRIWGPKVKGFLRS